MLQTTEPPFLFLLEADVCGYLRAGDRTLKSAIEPICNAAILNYCRTKVRFGVVEAVNGNIRTLINRGRGYHNLRYLLLKAKRVAVTNVEFVAVQRVKKAA